MPVGCFELDLQKRKITMLTFNETALSGEILKAVDKLGFEHLTPIQEECIPAILNSENDLIAQAQTGTGKTAAFGLPLIQLTELDSLDIQTLVLCPTRELCIQIKNDLVNYSKFVPDFNVLAVYGGTNISEQIKALRKGTHMVVGTPGRVLDLIKRKVLKVQRIEWLVLDEADEMLNMGFKEDLDAILSNTPEHKRTLLFSATMPKEVLRIANTYMMEATEISVGKRNVAAENVKHELYVVHSKDRYEALKRLADINPKIYAIVFCRTRRETKEVADKLMNDGYNADALHGDLSQAQRDYVMNRFRIKHLQLLIATDVAARGLDVNDLTHVINYNLPDDPEVYIHRSGRTGRAGKQGISIAITHTRETRKVREIEKLASIKFAGKKVPKGRDICEKQLFNLVDKVENIEVDDSQIEEYLPVIYKKLSWLDRDELIKHFVSVEFNRFLSYYKNAPDLNAKAKAGAKDSPKGRIIEDKKGRKRRDRDDGKDRGSREAEEGFARFYISAGSKDNLDPARLIGLINESTRNRNIEVGKIDILRKFSFFEVDKNYEDEIPKAFKRIRLDGKPVTVQISKPDGEFKPKSEKREKFHKERKKHFSGNKKKKRR